MKKYTKEEIFSILKKHHGVQVAFTDEDRKKALENPSLELYLTGLNSEVKKHKASPTPVIPFSLFRRFEEDGNRKFYEDQYFNRRQKLLSYSLHYWLYRDEDTLVYLQDIIWAILEEYTWCIPAHLQKKGLVQIQSEDTYVVDLFASETGHALSECLSLVGEFIHPIIKDRIHREIDRRILKRAFENKGEFFWHNCTNNWSAVCSGSVGMTAIYEIEDDERLAEIIYDVLLTLENFYRGFSDDGACLEGTGYWLYGFGYFMYFADMLYRRTEGEINLFDDSHIKDIAFFYTKVFFNGARTVSFSDGSSRGKCYIAPLAIMKKYYPDYKIPGAEFIAFGYSGVGCARYALAVREVVYCHPDFKFGKNNIVGTYVLPSAEWYVSSAQNGVGIAAKAGNNSEPHNHNDVGGFLVYKNGESIISDIGSGEYTRQYFSSERYSIFCNSSASHSVPIINGEYQTNGREYSAKDVNITEDGITSDISDAYPTKSLKSLRRSVAFDRDNGEIKVKDSYHFDERPSSVIERFITCGDASIVDGYVELTTGNEKMRLYYEREKCEPSIDTVVDKDHAAKDRLTTVIDFKIKSPTEAFDVEFSLR